MPPKAPDATAGRGDCAQGHHLRASYSQAARRASPACAARVAAKWLAVGVLNGTGFVLECADVNVLRERGRDATGLGRESEIQSQEVLSEGRAEARI